MPACVMRKQANKNVHSNFLYITFTVFHYKRGVTTLVIVDIKLLNKVLKLFANAVDTTLLGFT